MPRISTTAALAIPVSAVMLLSAGGCVAGNTTRVEKPTTGRELIELKEAFDRGAITQAEYEHQKARFLGPTSNEVVQVQVVETDQN